MADGYALIEINQNGEGRLKDCDVKWFDIRMGDICFDDYGGVEQLVDQLSEEINDVLVLFTFDYVCECDTVYWGEYECDIIFNIVSYQIVKTDYKEFYRQMVTEELNLGINGFNNLYCLDETEITFKDGDYYKELVSLWEEFYDEEFLPFVNETKNINDLNL